MRILIAEDEPTTQRYLVQGLREVGFSVDAVDDGTAALTLLREHSFDAAVLDIMLPGRDGWSIVTALRAEANRTPVLFLTARDHVEDRVRGFELGADDYLIKPFAFAELVARLRNIGVGKGASSLARNRRTSTSTALVCASKQTPQTLSAISVRPRTRPR